MIILITNDDGIYSDGIRCLENSLGRICETWTVAPDRPRNAIGRALTLHRPLKATYLSNNRIKVDGTPSDCVNLAVNRLLPEKPCLVVSGINNGANMGDDIPYSGTVAAAFEATILNVPAIAVSLPHNGSRIFDPAADFTERLSRAVIKNGLPEATFLNVNAPDTNGKSLLTYRITCQGRSIYDNSIIERRSPRGETYYWIGGDGTKYMNIPGSDANAVKRGHVSITPLSTDMTNHSATDFFSQWNI